MASLYKKKPFVVSLAVLAVVISSLALLEAYAFKIPFLFADDWVLTYTLVSNSVMDAILAGHNGIPSYFQNALYLVDYHFFDYSSLLQRAAGHMLWLAGLCFLVGALKKAGLKIHQVSVIISIFVIYWFTKLNWEQFFYYPLSALDASGVFVFLTPGLYMLVRFQRNVKGEEEGSLAVAALLTLLCVWPALFFHGGFALVPVFSVIILLLCRDRRVVITVLTVLVLFILHYKKVHYQLEPGELTVDIAWWEFFVGWCVYVGAMPFRMLEPYIGVTATMIATIVYVSSFVALAARLAVFGLRGRLSGVGAIALAFSGFVILLATAAVAARVRVNGWEYLLSHRYFNYSIYSLMVFVLCLFDLQVYRRMRRYVGVMVLVISTVALFDAVTSIREAPRLRNHFETFMIPYTLEPGTLASGELGQGRRLESALKARPEMLAGKNVFGTTYYQHFRQYMESAADMASVAKLDLKTKIIFQYPIEAENRLTYFSVSWPDDVEPYMVLMVDQKDKALGWGIPRDEHTVIARWLRPGSTQPYEAIGFAQVPEAVGNIYVLLLDKAGSVIGRSDSI